MYTPTTKEIETMALAVIEAAYQYHISDYGAKPYICGFCDGVNEHKENCPYTIAFKILGSTKDG